MKNIKFRAKKINTQEWVYGYYVHYDDVLDGIDDCDYIVEKYDGEKFPFIKVDTNTLGQYIGLKDKKGKEIYEGDIVVTRFKTGEICSIGDVQFDCGVFGVEWSHNKKNKAAVGGFGQRHNLRRLDDDIINEIEVIGNIYDNLELLKVG